MNYNPNGLITQDEFNFICLQDLMNKRQIQVISDTLENVPQFIRLINKAHFSPRLNRFVKLPLKWIWYPFLHRIRFSRNEPICFIVANSGLPLGYLKYLRMHFTNCKIVRIYRDLIRVCEINPDYTGKNLDEVYDLRFSIDEEEARRNNIKYFHEIESRIDLKCSPPFLYDVFFAGKGKDRLEKIVKAYDILSKAGLKCNFIITHIPTEERVIRDGIEYYDEFMPYLEMLQLTAKAKCLLDINQDGALGFTSRFLEAVMYNKLLITNNSSVLKSKYYRKDYIQYVAKIDDIDPGFVTSSMEVDYKYNNEFSPVHLIEQIERELKKLE